MHGQRFATDAINPTIRMGAFLGLSPKPIGGLAPPGERPENPAMPNKFIAPLADGGWIAPRSESYAYLTPPPQRVGDDAEITTPTRRRSFVRLLKAANGHMFLVELKRR
jgi:hypothetical protein